MPNSPDLSDPMLSGVRHRFEERPHPSSCPPKAAQCYDVEDNYSSIKLYHSRPSQRPSTLKENFRI